MKNPFKTVTPGTYRVMRDCCTSGNCDNCHGKSPVGEPIRVVQMERISKTTAELVANNWKAYKAVVEQNGG